MITREDVAKLAGVSVSTVSRTLNERGYISQVRKKGHKKIAYAVPDVLVNGERLQSRSILIKADGKGSSC